jgi:hypothetical protein
MRSDPDVENFTSSAASLPRTFRARSEFVRCCIYLMVGGWISIGLAYALRQQPWVPSGVAIGISILCLTPLLLFLYVSTYRIVLDERGIARRRLFWWTLWPWEDLAAGHIRRSDTGYTLIHRQRPWWDRWLVPDLLPSDEIRFLSEVVAETSPSQAPLTKPVHEMRLKWHVFPQPLLINQAGCQLASQEWLLWENIAEFRLQDSLNEGRTHRRLCITMADGTCHSKLLREIAWNETTIDPVYNWDLTWIAVLQSVVPVRCWKHFRLEGELQSVEEGEYRLQLNTQRIQASRVPEIAAWLWLLLYGIKIAPGLPRVWNDPFLGPGWKILLTALAVFMLGSMPAVVQVIAWQTRKRLRGTRREIEQQIATFRETASTVAKREFAQQQPGEAAARKPNFSISPAGR